MKILTGMALGAIALGAITLTAPQPATAQMDKLMEEVKAKVSDEGHAKAIVDRRMHMRTMGGSMKTVGTYLKAGEGSPADVAAAANTIAESADQLLALFPAGTAMGDYEGATGAKPEIWSMKSDFEKATMTLKESAENLAKVASADGATKEQIAAAFGPVGKDGCGACHRTFRQKLN